MPPASRKCQKEVGNRQLAGGEQAIREPRRTAVGLLYEVFGEGLLAMQELAPVQAFSARELELVQTMLKRNLNAPLTSSVGRLFDAVAAIVGLRQTARFEGQTAMELEFALDGMETDEAYPFRISEGGIRSTSANGHPPSAIVVDWEPILRSILDDMRRGIPVGEISAKFHNTLVEIIVAMARRVGEERIVLTGGCFQNKYLTERAVRRLQAAGFRPYWHQRVPPNDGGIALGQAVAALRERPKE